MNHHQHKYFLPITIEAVCGGNYSTAHTTMNALYLLALEFRTRFPLAGKRVHTYTQDWGVSDVEACLALSSTHLQRVYLSTPTQNQMIRVRTAAKNSHAVGWNSHEP